MFQLKKLAHVTQKALQDKETMSRPTPIKSVEQSTLLKPYTHLHQETIPLATLDRVLTKE
jgi:hypothetical protein